MEGTLNRAAPQHRREPRYHADIAGTLIGDGIAQPVTIRNISAYGALLAGAHLPPVGTRVTLVAERTEIAGTVIWLREEHCGLLLASRIEPLDMLAPAPALAADDPMPPVVTLRRMGPGRYA